MIDPPDSAGSGGGGAAGAEGPLARGLGAFAARDLSAAHAAFERAHRLAPREPRAMSWYGVTLVLVEKNVTLGVSLCEAALRPCPDDPELSLNLARVHLALHQRERAARALTRGLAARPDHPGLLEARRALGTRRSPVVSFLPRGSAINRLLGGIRHRWITGKRPVHELTPETLGLPGVPGAPSRS